MSGALRSVRRLGGAPLWIGVVVAGAVCAAQAGTAAATPGHQPIEVVLTLNVDAAGLQRFASAVSTPGSSSYGDYESVSELARRFGASARERRAVIGWLRAHGAGDVRIDATGSLAEATMDPTLAQRLFRPQPVALAARSASDPGARRVPRALRGLVGGVFGLDSQPIGQQMGLEVDRARAAGASQPSSELPRSGTPSGCTAGVATGAFTPNQYLTAYDFGPLYQSGLTGQGQRAALIEIDSLKVSDLATFAGCFGLRVPPIRQFPVGLRHLPAPGGEATLDAEVLDAAAPGLSGIDVYVAKPDIASVLTALTAPLDRRSDLPQVIAISLGACDPVVRAALGVSGLKASQFAIQTATASGVTMVAAAGDTGSAGCQRNGKPPLRKLAVLYPASSWWVTAVGGTNLYLTADNRLADEVVWNDAGLNLGAGGGGFSSIWTRPPAQNGVVKRNSRAVPDISMLADVKPGYAIYCTTRDCRRQSPSGPWLSAGGTSAAAPLFAGGLALIDELLRIKDREYLGNLDPALYVIAETPSDYPLVFNDVTRIGNDIGPFIPEGGGRPLGCCTAGPGYDEASGWGSVDLTNLAALMLRLQPPAVGNVSASVPGNQHPVAAGRLKVRITCSEACYAVADVGVYPHGGRMFEAYSHGTHLSHRGSRVVAVRFSSSQLRTLRSALAHHEPITGLAYGVITTSAFLFEKYSAPAQFKITS